MKLEKREAIKLLEEARVTTCNTNWIDHSLCVGKCARRIAEKLNLDGEKAEVLGYIHDIGKRSSEMVDHTIEGYEFIKSLGYDEEYYNICLSHSYLNNDYYCIAGEIPEDIPFRTGFVKNHQYSIYEKIVQICDLMCTNRVMVLEQRLIEIMVRKGVFDNTVYHVKEAQKLKEEIDELLGENLYNLFPEIKENL